MAAPTDVLWLGNDGPPPPNPQTESVFHLSTAGDVLLPTLPNVSATGIAFDGTFLYFNNDGVLTKRDLNGTLLAVVFVLFWILRKIPVYPLTLLAPHQLTP